MNAWLILLMIVVLILLLPVFIVLLPVFILLLPLLALVFVIMVCSAVGTILIISLILGGFLIIPVMLLALLAG